MATDVGSMPNGNYAPHQGYGGIDQNAYAYNANSLAAQAPTQQVPPASTTPSAQVQQPQSDISKDEVGWYFVEQYYTTLSRSPEKLYLFYNKRSQFVSGQETDKVAVCVGQRAINDKIKDLDYQDCKVRVTNVDSQASDSNIVIQVIGELSNRGQPHRKFTQTFVLATQTNGYFVLNDIFRFLIDEEEEPEQQETPAAASEDVQQVPGTESGYQEPPPTEAEPKTLTSSSDPAAVKHDAKEVDQGIEDKLNKEPAAEETAPTVNGDSTHETAKPEETPATATQPAPVPAAEEERPAANDADLEPEKPEDPEPTPEPTPAKPAAPQQQSAAPKPVAPAAPLSWASRAAAANRVATPTAPAPAASAAPRAAVPAAKTTTPPSTAASSTPSVPAAATPTAPAAQRQEAQGSESQDEWNTVGPSHNRQQSRQTNVQQEGPQHRGYIKNVMENVDAGELRAALEKFGKLLYFDVARQKNCAFVDFETAEGYKSAVSTPIEIGGEKLFVEERRIRPGSTPYVPRGQFQGGRGGGRGGAFQGNRGGNNAGRGRGGFPPGRGGRGGAQA